MGLTFSGMVLNLNGISIVSRPDAPTVGTATATGQTTATVDFTAPKYNGGATITSYTAVSSPDGITGTINQAGSGTITVSGLSMSTAYTFTVYATNSEGASANSSASNQITTQGPVTGQAEFTTAGTYTWVAPAGVTSVSVVAIGGGGSGGCAYGGGNIASGGGGGALSFKNNITVVPGNSYTVVVGAGGPRVGYSATNGTAGGESYFINISTVQAGGGGGGPRASGVDTVGGTGGTRGAGDGGGNGGAGGGGNVNTYNAGGGGGAGGYAGNGGVGGSSNSTLTLGAGGNGAGGGGGGGNSGTSPSTYPNQAPNPGGGGGGTGIYGQGSNGSGAPEVTHPGYTYPIVVSGGGGGSAGGNGNGYNITGVSYFNNDGYGGAYGGGGAAGWASPSGSGGVGAVRIIWPGTTRQFPSTRTANE